jgi:hypothetical protein
MLAGLQNDEESNMTKTNLLVTSAIVALMAAGVPSVAQQQSAPQREHMAPAEKMAPQKAPGREAPENRGRAETTGQAPHEEGQSRPSQRNSEQERSKTEHLQNQDRPTGQTQREQRDRMGGNSERDRTTGQGPSQQNRTDPERERTDRSGGSRETTGQGTAGVRANITSETRTRIHEVIVREQNAPRVANPNFEVSVGTRVPRTVRFVALPLAVVEIEPAWRGFEYFLIGDRMVVVNPRSMEIVAIVDA